MTRYRATVAYDGTGYHGFQRQAAEHEPTIQGEVERALTKMGQPDITVTGSGRTDAGVHATGQVIAFQRRMAAWLWMTCNVRSTRHSQPTSPCWTVHEAAPDFHPRYDAVSREYVYTIYNAPVRHPLKRMYALHVAEPLDVTGMNAAAAVLVGEHDLAAFGNPTAGQVTVRRMLRAHVSAEPPLIRVELEANGFLYRMVRSIVGTLLAVGRGSMTPDEFRAVLESRDRSRAEVCGACTWAVPDARELLIES